MTPAETVAAMYEREGVSFRAVLEAHLLHGYVFAGPDWFVMGRAVGGNDSSLWLDFGHLFPVEQCDAWCITAAAGDWRAALRLFPYPLPWVLWQRFGRDNSFRRYRVASLCKSFQKSNAGQRVHA
jgi:hypothetical protein